MIHAIHVADGKARYRNRWVRTEQYLAQRKAGRRLVGTGFGEPPAPGGEGIALNVANTNVVWHGGKLLALDEGSQPSRWTATRWRRKARGLSKADMKAR